MEQIDRDGDKKKKKKKTYENSETYGSNLNEIHLPSNLNELVQRLRRETETHHTTELYRF